MEWTLRDRTRSGLVGLEDLRLRLAVRRNRPPNRPERVAISLPPEPRATTLNLQLLPSTSSEQWFRPVIVTRIPDGLLTSLSWAAETSRQSPALATQQRRRGEKKHEGGKSKAPHGSSSSSRLEIQSTTGRRMLACAPMKRLGLVVGGVLLCVSALSAQPASAPWRTIDTPHFRVHFPAPFEAWAAHAASAIEGIHERVTDFVGYRPAKPIDVVVEDPAADANGMAYPFLDRPEIVLWTSPPEAESDSASTRTGWSSS